MNTRWPAMRATPSGRLETITDDRRDRPRFVAAARELALVVEATSN
jgi:hypothetical protein